VAVAAVMLLSFVTIAALSARAPSASAVTAATTSASRARVPENPAPAAADSYGVTQDRERLVPQPALREKSFSGAAQPAPRGMAYNGAPLVASGEKASSGAAQLGSDSERPTAVGRRPRRSHRDFEFMQENGQAAPKSENDDWQFDRARVSRLPRTRNMEVSTSRCADEYAGAVSKSLVESKEVERSAEFLQSRQQQTPETEDQVEIRKMMSWAWEGYRKHAFGADILRPISQTREEWFRMGGTIIDAIDTLWIMGMKTEYEQARDWVRDSLDVKVDAYEQLFETVIRCLGGLLSIYALTDEQVFLDKATELGYNMLPAFELSPHCIPFRDVNLKHGTARGNMMILAEVTTLQLEYKYLAALTGESRFAEAANRAQCAIQRLMPQNALIPVNIDIVRRAARGPIAMGGNGDSHYEYLLKQWLLTRRSEPEFWRWYKLSMDSMIDKMIFNISGDRYERADRYAPGQMMYVTEMSHGATSAQYTHRMDHLACFSAGMLLLGRAAANESSPSLANDELMRDHEIVAEGLLNTCSAMYLQMPTNLSPESVSFSEGKMRPSAPMNIQRPEAVESLFIFARLRWDQREQYQAVGRVMYRAFEKHMRVPTGGYASLRTVLTVPTDVSLKTHYDKQETFFLAETLKYLYLLFSDDKAFLHPGQHWVFNTEAHPLPTVPLSDGLRFACPKI